MALTRLLIKDFRNIEAADLALVPGFNFLVGANGSGKTSVLEAIYTLGHGRAFRSIQAGRVIRHDQSEFVLHGRIDGTETERSVGLSKNRQGDSKVRIDGSDGHKVAELAQLLPIQLITPEGFTLLNGGPKFRRAFLDWGCFHNEPGFFAAWSNMKRLLRQRNAALRQVSHYGQLRAWDQELVPLAERISEWRAQYAKAIANDIAATCTQFLPEFSLGFSFQRGWDKESEYAELLERQFERDRMLGYTALGPHKADFRIRASGVAVEDMLSRGQLKLLMCALRLAQGEFLTRQNGLRCLYLIDDFASELDSTRRRLLAERLKATHAQVFVSAVSAEQIEDMIGEKGKMFRVEQGKITVQSQD
ncbi:DNA replication/repair protein RecF [Pectobacterium punjabense]|uniref:DNA replication and repair protein RecF n=1 Tax=Pectobacterium punjabense TaxID=2108399 RepID=A0ABX6KW75_9GAMM|nr:DNA replication/repair protein RecF [Pectobacterium punjabense]GKW13016.1 DNA replication and repair protein RecF [Pectobacterium carotovorum subsp. carotovorum]MBN3135378.1 DNA replication/repair protein RecF [Pectobacterium punjabense]MBS4429529.1 DNA replication/repair protein RecF [Pectobacterium punjabense]MBT9185524.1 DNA replication/repair protein RecF [Pectobacterium punjabense]MCE5381789.1 DNA replication/repair protein RecF [Pectobacterium punjabense]